MSLASPPRRRISAHRNESPLPAPDHVIAALRTIDGDALRRYPAALARELECTLATRLDVAEETLVVGSGADDILFGLARTFLEPGDDILTVRPTFDMYARIAATAGARTTAVSYAKRWRVDPAAMTQRATPRTRLVVLGSPNNPTGDTLEAETLRAIARALSNAIIVLDEVYLTFSPDSLLPVAMRLPNVVVLGSFSKVAALAGIRVGYAVAQPKIAGALRAASAPFPVSVPSLVAATAYVGGGAETEAFERRLEVQVQRSLDAIEGALRPFARSVARGPANFVLFEFGETAEPLMRDLATQGIDVRQISGPDLDGAVRINALDDDDTRELIAAIKRILTLNARQTESEPKRHA